MDYSYDATSFGDFMTPSPEDRSFLGNFLGGLLTIPGKIYNDITGQTSQNKEFEQQEYLMDKQNEYNTPVNQMARMKAAGINPNTAAAGIAGTGSTSAQPSAVNTNTGGVANAIGSAAGLLGAVGSSSSDLANANRTNELLEHEKRKMIADTTLALEEAGLSHWSALSMGVRLPLMTANDQADFYLKLANIGETKQRYKNLLAEHDNIVAELNEIISRTKLNISEAEVNEAQKALIQENARWQKAENDFWENEGYLRSQPSDMALRNCVVNDNIENAEKIGGAIETSSNREHTGFVEAEKSLQTHVSQLKEQVQKAVDDNRISKETQQKLDVLFNEVLLDMQREWQNPSSNPYSLAEKLLARITNMLTFRSYEGSKSPDASLTRPVPQQQ